MWEKWFAAAGLKKGSAQCGIDYNDAAIFLKPAIVGEGIALARHSLIATEGNC